MDRIKIMVNGMPGSMAVSVARHALNNDRFEVIPHSCTGPEIQEETYRIGSKPIRLIKPDERDDQIPLIIQKESAFISVDYTHPKAVNANAEFYCKWDLPFVMGTTGGDREQLAETVAASSTSAVIAPNMAKQIVGFQAMMAYAAEFYPNLFKGYTIRIKESHQEGKADTSGTAKAMIGFFNQLGIPVNESDIIMVRDPDEQVNDLGVPESYVTGHAWHTYTLNSAEGTVRFQFTHNVNGRDIYAKGTLDAVAYLSAKIKKAIQGKVYTMIDVLKGA